MYACVPCGLCWDNREEQSQHVKSDFHRYNLKRRVAGLEPALESDFNLKMSILASTGPELTQVIGGPKMPRRKRLLKKHKGDRMQNANVLLETGKDMPESTRQGRDESEGGNSSEDQDDVGEDEASECDPYEDTQCLFDGNTYGSFDDNLEAMRAQYSLMVPDEQYCLDLREFLRYLGAKVYEGHLCLWCNRQFRSTLAVQNHMLDKGHQRIGCHLDEQIEEYALFFDYSTSYLELNLPEEIKRKLVAIANGEELLELTDVEDEAEQTEVEQTEVEEAEQTEVEETEVEEAEQTEAEKTEQRIVEHSNFKDMGWPEVLRKLGYRKPEITEDGDLYLPNSDRVVLNRIRYNKHQKIITRPAMRMRQPRAIIALTQYSHLTDAQKKEIRRIAADIQKRQSNHDMRLGVKSNKHYRYIARKNKIFI